MSAYKRVDVITSMSKLTPLIHALSKAGISGITVLQALGCGVEKGTQEYEIEQNTELELLPKQMIILYIEADQEKEIIELIKKELYTGHIGDGKIFVSEVTNVIRVRTGEEGEEALK